MLLVDEDTDHAFLQGFDVAFFGEFAHRLQEAVHEEQRAEYNGRVSDLHACSDLVVEPFVHIFPGRDVFQRGQQRPLSFRSVHDILLCGPHHRFFA